MLLGDEINHGELLHRRGCLRAFGHHQASRLTIICFNIYAIVVYEIWSIINHVFFIRQFLFFSSSSGVNLLLVWAKYLYMTFYYR